MKYQGFGKYTTGGKGGKTIWVDTPENLRSALLLEEPRIIRFSKSGNYELPELIDVHNGNLTLDGSDNPVCTKGAYIRFFCDNVITRNMRFRPGSDHRIPSDGLNFWNSNNVVVDHCSFSWSVDELFQISGGGNITVQWCIFSEALDNAGHPEGRHSKGPWTTQVVQGLTMHHNLIAHCGDRVPVFSGGQIDLRNHIVYNPGWTRMGFFPTHGNLMANAVNTQWIWGFDTPNVVNVKASMSIEPREGNVPLIYLSGNQCPDRPNDNLPECRCVYRGCKDFSQYILNEEHKFPKVKTHSLEDAYELILNNAGAFPRDSVDARIAQDVRNGTGRIIDDPSEVGGWPDLTFEKPKKKEPIILQ